MPALRLALAGSLLLLGGSCALLARAYRPPHAPKEEAAEVKFPWGVPKERVSLTGVWLRAMTMAMDDFLPEAESELARSQGALAACTARRDSYSVEAWVWADQSTHDAGEDQVPEPDAGDALDPDAGESDSGTGEGWTQPGMPKSAPVIFVSISLIPDACDFGDSPPVDAGATYAIDTVNWRILAIHH